jgi:ubiquinone/menaquinone biosynthesis C-methylase UbiE
MIKSKDIGLPQSIDLDHACRLYEGVEYKNFWKETSRRNLDLLEQVIISSLIPVQGCRIVDIGCGFGRLADCYLDRFVQVTMLDGSMSLLRQAQKTVGTRATYVAADANHLPFRPASFDCLLLMRAFHHLHDSKVILSEVGRVLCSKGTFVFNYCSKLSLRQWFLWLLRRNRRNPLSLSPAGVGTDFISHHPKYVHQLLKQNGYSDIKYLGAGILDKIPDRSGHLVPLARWLAPFFGLTKLAPWINCRAVVSSPKTQDVKNETDDIFICPSCHGDLTCRPGAYICTSCTAAYSIEDGIIDFRLDTKEPL